MSKKHLSRHPHDIDTRAWWYEENHGIEIIVESLNEKMRHLKIPWVSVRAALKRKDRTP